MMLKGLMFGPTKKYLNCAYAWASLSDGVYHELPISLNCPLIIK